MIITEATISQELMRMGINKTSKEASNQEKVQAGLKYFNERNKISVKETQLGT